MEERPRGAHFATPVDDDDDFASAGDYEGIGRSAGLMTVLIVISRVTGFIRTWAMALGIGLGTISTAYQMSNNLPNTLYELVMGGMLVTAFMPVYMEVRRNKGKEGAEEYIGNLLGIVLLLLGGLSLLAVVFAPAVIWTQSFMGSTNADEASATLDLSVFFFRFMAVQILFYGLGSIFSGVLNAHREYFWSTFAPVLNNVVTIASFLAYGPLSQVNEALALTVIAVGATLGVFVQMACQIPALIRRGIRPRLHINFRDPALRETVSLGIPTLMATVCTFVLSSITNSAAMYVQPDTGASVISYSRLWYTLPYAVLAVPISTALYTELARDAAAGDDRAVRDGIARGASEIFFLLIPFALYIVAYSFPLNLIYASRAFTVEGVELVASYTAVLVLALPFYGQFVLVQKSFSALMDMKPYGRYCLLAAIFEGVYTVVAVVVFGAGLNFIAVSSLIFYLVLDGLSFRWLRRRLGGLHLKTIARGFGAGVVFGGLGAAAGYGVLELLQSTVGPLVVEVAGELTAASTVLTFAYIAVAGIVSLIVTFGLAALFRVPEARAIRAIVGRVLGRRARAES